MVSSHINIKLSAFMPSQHKRSNCDSFAGTFQLIVKHCERFAYFLARKHSWEKLLQFSNATLMCYRGLKVALVGICLIGKKSCVRTWLITPPNLCVLGKSRGY